MPPSTQHLIGADRAGPIGAHCIEQVRGLETNAFERGAGELLRAGGAREAEQRAAHVGIPMRRAEVDKGGNQIDVLQGIRAFSETAALLGARDDL